MLQVPSYPAPGLLHFLDVFTFPHSISSPCPPYKYAKSPAALGPTQELGSKHLQPLETHSPESFLMDACQSRGRQENSLHPIPGSGGSLPHSRLASARHWKGQCRWEEKLKPVPFAPQWAASCSVVQIAHALWGAIEAQIAP